MSDFTSAGPVDDTGPFEDVRAPGASRRNPPRQVPAWLYKVSPAVGGRPWARVPNFYSANEAVKRLADRFHHNDNRCGPGKDIPLSERRAGTGGYRLSKDCQKFN